MNCVKNLNDRLLFGCEIGEKLFYKYIVLFRYLEKRKNKVKTISLNKNNFRN